MMGFISVRKFSSQDEQDVINLILPIQQEEYGIPITLEDQPDLLQINRIYQQNAGNFWVAEHNGKIVGSIGLIDIGSGQAALRKMFVKKEYRGKAQGVALLLLNTAKEWAAVKGVNEIILGTTEQFVAAQRFYEKNDFQSVDKQDLPANYPVMAVDRKFYKYVI